MLILTQKEIVEVTGYKWKRKQMEELARRKCPFVVNGAGKLIVLRSDLFNHGEDMGEEPDFDAI